ncbi:M48 family metallopeptidase [Shewanella yunxiaonensis]|uniref:M48 family metallopeptidase n=2 Tax=Shewanella yunxiaonensis TaxID=2829809 RepID=A0ABX7YPV0_9GAMM|nr:YgjP-like metallopeptidase domain-containing protein [Shewanella yunxiaonensis]QUN04660.1 M48 family metallopeptidase [Shewanella yunxiaonensis]
MATDYLAHYSEEVRAKVTALHQQGLLPQFLLKRHPEVHQIRSDRALYDFTVALKNSYLKKSAPLAKVCFDDKITLSHQALGLHTYAARRQGNKVKTKNEIRISSRLKRAPEAFLRMLVVHELAHLKEKDHNKSFYQLCCHMEPEYHQLEFELRVYLMLADEGIDPYQGELSS